MENDPSSVDRNQVPSHRESEMTRRRLIELGAQYTFIGGATAWLAACGGGDGAGTTAGSASAGGGTPVRGGTFTVGMVTGGSAETVNPALSAQFSDTIRVYQLFDGLFTVNQDLKVEPRLATSAEASNDLSTWSIQLRDGVTWHNGKPLTADDVVYSFQGWGSPANFANAILAGLVDFKRVRKRGKLTVEVPMLAPVADLPALLTTFNQLIVQEGSTKRSFAQHPIGTGPFEFVSFKPGTTSTFRRFPDYFEHGKPYVDEVIIDSSFTDDNARLNALLSGKINVMPVLPFVQARAQQERGEIKVLNSPAIQNYQIGFRVDQAPFNDVRVRQAMKYIANREVMIESAFAGFGQVANDLFGGTEQLAVPNFAKSLQRPHDPEKARSLLKAAGQEGLTFEMDVAPVAAGYTEAATVFAQNAKEAGVTVKLKNVPTSTFLAVVPGGFLSRPVQLDSTFTYATLDGWYRNFYVSNAPLGETHWGSPARDKVINAAIGAKTPQAEEAWFRAQKQQFDEGGELIYASANYIDGCANEVLGLRTGPQLFLNNYRLLDGWISKG